MTPTRIIAAATLLTAVGGIIALAQPDSSSNSPPPAAADPGEMDALRARLETAWKAGDQGSMLAALDRAYAIDPVWTGAAAIRLATDADTTLRPIGLRVLLNHADVATLVRAIERCDRTRQQTERRWLTYAIGLRKLEEGKAPLAALLNDQDPMVQAAAATGIALLGDAKLAETLIPKMREAPALKATWSGDRQDILQMRVHGAFTTLTGGRPRSAAEARRWWRENGPQVIEKGPVTAPDGPTPTTVNRGKTYFQLPRFELSFEFGSGPKQAQEAAAAMAVLMQQATDRPLTSAQRVLGPLELAPIRLIIADRQRFAAFAGNSFRPGVSKGNEVVLLDGPAAMMVSTMAHEYVHVMHQATFENQPRWLSEGLAESLAVSTEKSVWSANLIARAGLDDAIRKGAFSELLNWRGPASSGDRENQLYALAHVAVDFLRFGPFAASDERLALFMGALSQRQNEAKAIEACYGLTVKDMDKALAEWVAMAR